MQRGMAVERLILEPNVFYKRPEMHRGWFLEVLRPERTVKMEERGGEEIEPV